MTSKSLKRAKAKAQKQAVELQAEKEIAKAAKKTDWARSVSDAMTSSNWQQAVEDLRSMRAAGQVPKLGAVQRWVRLADLSGREDLAALLLDAIMRTAAGAGKGAAKPAGAAQPAVRASTAAPAAAAAVPAAAAAAAVPVQGGNVELVGVVRRHAAWCPAASASEAVRDTGAEEAAAAAAVARYEGHVHVVGTDDAPHMAAPNPIFLTDPGVILFDGAGASSTAAAAAAGGERNAGPGEGTGDKPAAGGELVPPASAPAPARVEVPFVDGAFVLTNVLSRREVAQIVAVSERMGYALDADYTFAPAAATGAPGSGPADGAGGAGGLRRETGGAASSSAARASAGGERAAGCVWLADDSLLGPVWQRVKTLLPQHLGGGDLAGLNARWRLYRYDQGTVYRPHVDGAWPGSGLKDGRVVFDSFGDRWSRLTFLVYLNDGFEGGSTTFYTPGPDEGVLEARGVSPRAGNILVFPHGDSCESLIHEGSAVTRGVKYVIRTDVLYMLPPKAARAPDARRAAASQTSAGPSVKVKHRA